MPRLNEDAKPPKQRFIQNARKWVKFLRSVLKNKFNQHLQYAFDRLRILIASKYGKNHLMAYRLKKLFAHGAVNLKEVGLRRILLYTFRVSRSNGLGVLTKRKDLFNKALGNFTNLLNSKIKGNARFVLLKLIANKKVVSKLNHISRYSLLVSFEQIIKAKLLTGFVKIREHYHWVKGSKHWVIKCLKVL